MIKKIFLLLLPLFLVACSNLPKYVAMDSRTKSSLGEVGILSVIPQDEIIVVAANPGVTAAMGGGLIGALIDSQIAKNRQNDIQKVVEPFYAAIDDVDFRKLMWAAFAPSLHTAFDGKISEIRNTPLSMTPQERDQRIASLAPGKSFMYIGSNYSFTRDLTQLNVITSVDLWTGGRPEQVYSNVFNYRSAAVENKTAPMTAWADDGGKRYRAAIGESIREMVGMFQVDLKHPRLEGVDQGRSAPVRNVTVPIASGAYPLTITGPVLAEQGNRIIVRHADGRLYSLSR
ncbi:MAG: hypothetical protein V4632_12435 [Pseudomonadota bacterium]